MASCPSLANLSLKTGAVGACIGDSSCFETWRAALLNEGFARQGKNTVVLLSAGEAVLETAVLGDIWEMLGLKLVWLVDTEVDRATGDAVKERMQVALPGTKIVYFTGKTAYADATAELDSMGDDQVIAVGILNNPPVTKKYNAINYEAQTYRTDLEPIALVEALYVPFQWGKKNDQMRVIVAYKLEGQVVNYSWRADYWAETKKRTIAREMLKTSEIFVRELEKDFHAARQGSVVS